MRRWSISAACCARQHRADPQLLQDIHEQNKGEPDLRLALGIVTRLMPLRGYPGDITNGRHPSAVVAGPTRHAGDDGAAAGPSPNPAVAGGSSVVAADRGAARIRPNG